MEQPDTQSDLTHWCKRCQQRVTANHAQHEDGNGPETMHHPIYHDPDCPRCRGQEDQTTCILCAKSAPHYYTIRQQQQIKEVVKNRQPLVGPIPSLELDDERYARVGTLRDIDLPSYEELIAGIEATLGQETAQEIVDMGTTIPNPDADPDFLEKLGG